MNRLEVTFRNLKTSEWLERAIRNRVSKLETYYPQIVSCRVLVAVPHRHHDHGNPFEVHIEIVVPGEEIAVSRAPRVRELTPKDATSATKRMDITAMRKDVLLVVRGAFDAAKRQLQNYARRRRHAVKAHTARRAAVGA
ncbi:MAG TPA: HPF/RaiA family ribosome-associated protein [Vicinamibacterales bacterium]|nr:HPF/RaiA family ribosome-associated protein [Vicinamibacterales bacterium]